MKNRVLAEHTGWVYNGENCSRLTQVESSTQIIINDFCQHYKRRLCHLPLNYWFWFVRLGGFFNFCTESFDWLEKSTEFSKTGRFVLSFGANGSDTCCTLSCWIGTLILLSQYARLKWSDQLSYLSNQSRGLP